MIPLITANMFISALFDKRLKFLKTRTDNSTRENNIYIQSVNYRAFWRQKIKEC